MKQLSDKNMEGFPRVYQKGLVKNQPYIAMDRLGPSLKDIPIFLEKHFSVQCICSIGCQLVDLLETVHDCGLIHADLKPDNILVGNYLKDSRQMNVIHLIDFGISVKYIQDGKHVPEREGLRFRGSVFYASINCL